MVSVMDLAASLGVGPEDIEVLLAQRGETPTADTVPVVIADDIRLQLDPHCERSTMPELYTG
jgi:glutaredoxin-related protein